MFSVESIDDLVKSPNITFSIPYYGLNVFRLTRIAVIKMCIHLPRHCPAAV